MDYQNLVKKIDLPEGFNAPRILEYEDIIAKPLSRKDLIADMAAVNSSLDLIRETRGGSWPSEAVSEEFDLLDLAWHEKEFRDGDSFAYVIYTNAGAYVGCFYLYGMGHRTPLTDELLDFQVDASWWVDSKAYNDGYYKKLQAALNIWLPDQFGFTNIYYSNKEM
jgi:hypothetical protein